MGYALWFFSGGCSGGWLVCLRGWECKNPSSVFHTQGWCAKIFLSDKSITSFETWEYRAILCKSVWLTQAKLICLTSFLYISLCLFVSHCYGKSHDEPCFIDSCRLFDRAQQQIWLWALFQEAGLIDANTELKGCKATYRLQRLLWQLYVTGRQEYLGASLPCLPRGWARQVKMHHSRQGHWGVPGVTGHAL